MTRIAPFYRSIVSEESPFRMLDSFFNDTWLSERINQGSFRLDIKDSEDAYLVEADMPGIAKEEISLELKDSKLCISVERQQENGDDKFLHRERVYSSMSRTVYLKDAAYEGIEAKLTEGVLRLSIPKANKALPSSKIEIQ